MSKIYVIHHFPCTDGLGAKYAAWRKFGDSATYIPANYGQPVPELESGSEVYIADFSYPKEVLRAWHGSMSKLQVLDHHVSAQRDLDGEPYAIFDMEKSGAVLAWEYFHPGTRVPSLLEYIQDRDLWRWKLEGTRDVLNCLSIRKGANETDVSHWDSFSTHTGAMKEAGVNVSAFQDQQLESLTREGTFKQITFMGYKAIVINSNFLTSEIGSKFARYPDIDLAIVWQVNAEGNVNLSLRGNNRVDVSVLAKQLGGGGHANAAGARVPISWLTTVYEQSDSILKPA